MSAGAHDLSTRPLAKRSAFNPHSTQSAHRSWRRALIRADVLVDPTLGLALPAPRGGRDRIAPPAEAKGLLAALHPEDQVVWATALFAGLRRGEIRGLSWGDVDFAGGLIRVEQSWDDRVGPIEPKSTAGRRRVPLARPRRLHLATWRLRSHADDDRLVFADERGGAINTTALTGRARKRKVDQEREQEVAPPELLAYAVDTPKADAGTPSLSIPGESRAARRDPWVGRSHPR
jgi:integrase